MLNPPTDSKQLVSILWAAQAGSDEGRAGWPFHHLVCEDFLHLCTPLDAFQLAPWRLAHHQNHSADSTSVLMSY
jgi:hypothetical protein